jgi:hypothetical protein
VKSLPWFEPQLSPSLPPDTPRLNVRRSGFVIQEISDAELYCYRAGIHRAKGPHTGLCKTVA